MFEDIKKSIDDIFKEMEKPTDSIVELGYELHQIHRLTEFIIIRTQDLLTRNLATIDPDMIKKLKADFADIQLTLYDDLSSEMDFRIEQLKEQINKDIAGQYTIKGNEKATKSTNQKDNTDKRLQAFKQIATVKPQ